MGTFYLFFRRASMKITSTLLLLVVVTTLGTQTSGFLKLHHEANISDINPCKDKDILSCIPASVDTGDLDRNTLLLPNGLVMGKTREFQDGKTSFVLFSDNSDNEAFFAYRNNRVMGKLRLDERTMYFLEPCNNWEGCHVWKMISQETFVDEYDELSVEKAVLSEKELETQTELLMKGKTDDQEVAKYSIMFYYTQDFASHTDDIELFMETIIGDMNLGYENSDIPVRVKLHCIESTDLEDEAESSDMLHVFNKFKPSYSDIRESADAAQLLANNFHNCGSGYTYTATGSAGHTLSVVKKSCAFGYHSSIHEVGHNFGCQHDQGNGHNSHYDYGYGYLLGPYGLDGIGYRTAMAYNADGHKTRVNYLSNPRVEYKGYPTGDADSADNARVVKENRFLMADIGNESKSCNAF